MVATRFWLCVLPALLLTGVGCEGSENDESKQKAASAEGAQGGSEAKESTGSTGAAPKGRKDKQADGQSAGPVAKGESFELRAAAAPQYDSGSLGQFEVTLTGRGKWHINQDFPVKVSVAAPGEVELTKRELKKSDAAEFAEEKARFEIPFTPQSKGEHRVEAEVSFAMCTPETCVPQKKKLAVKLPVSK
jgi:hypothetical protein